MNTVRENIAIFGANGAIGKALCNHYINQSNVFAFSRKDFDLNHEFLNKSFLTEYEEGLISQKAKNFNDEFFNKIIISIGMLHNEDYLPEKRIDDFSSDQFFKTIESNLLIPTLITKYFHRKLKKEQSTLAILSARVGSISDNRTGGWYSYRASKAGLNMTIKNLSVELGRLGRSITVIGLHPGTVDSRLSQPFQKNLEDSKIFSANYSVSKLTSVIDSVNVNSSGKCIAWDGTEILP